VLAGRIGHGEARVSSTVKDLDGEVTPSSARQEALAFPGAIFATRASFGTAVTAPSRKPFTIPRPQL
jgi:hypothetical protein